MLQILSKVENDANVRVEGSIIWCVGKQSMVDLFGDHTDPDSMWRACCFILKDSCAQYHCSKCICSICGSQSQYCISLDNINVTQSSVSESSSMWLSWILGEEDLLDRGPKGYRGLRLPVLVFSTTKKEPAWERRRSPDDRVPEPLPEFHSLYLNLSQFELAFCPLPLKSSWCICWVVSGFVQTSNCKIFPNMGKRVKHLHRKSAFQCTASV